MRAMRMHFAHVWQEQFASLTFALNLQGYCRWHHALKVILDLGACVHCKTCQQVLGELRILALSISITCHYRTARIFR